MFEKYNPNLDIDDVIKTVKKQQGFTRKTQVMSYLTHHIPLEKKFQADVIKGIRKAFPTAYVVKISLAHYSTAGIPDVMAIVDGHYFGFEIKRPVLSKIDPDGHGATKLQLETMKQINNAGGTCNVVCYPEEAVEVIKKWMETR